MTPWARQPGETAKAFAAFELYRDGGPNRSTRGVAHKLGKSAALIQRWSRRHNWGERVAAFDAHIQAVAQEAEEQKAKESAGLWARRLAEVREQDWADALALRRKAAELLARKTGARWSLSDIARVIEVASKLARLAAGLPSDRQELTGADGAPVAPGVVVVLPDNGAGNQ